MLGRWSRPSWPPLPRFARYWMARAQPADHRTPLRDQPNSAFPTHSKIRVISPGLAAQRPGQPGHAEPAVPSGRRELEWSQAPRIWATPTGVSDGCRSQNRARWPAATGSHSAVLRQRQAPLPLARGDGCLIRRKPWPRWWNLRDRSGVASDGPTYAGRLQGLLRATVANPYAGTSEEARLIVVLHDPGLHALCDALRPTTRACWDCELVPFRVRPNETSAVG